MMIALYVLYVRIQFSWEVFSGFSLQKFPFDLCIHNNAFIRGDHHRSSLSISGGMLFPQAYCCTQDHWTVPYSSQGCLTFIFKFQRFEGTVLHSALREGNQSNARDYGQHFKFLTFIEATVCHLPLLGGNIYTVCHRVPCRNPERSGFLDVCGSRSISLISCLYRTSLMCKMKDERR